MDTTPTDSATEATDGTVLIKVTSNERFKVKTTTAISPTDDEKAHLVPEVGVLSHTSKILLVYETVDVTCLIHYGELASELEAIDKTSECPLKRNT